MFLITSSSALIMGVAKFIYSSKCRECSFFGCKIIRDTVAEESIDELTLNNQPPSQVINRTGTPI